MQDAMRNPEITYVYTEAYQGQVGDPLIVSAVEPHKITETVAITDPDGTIIETGLATRVRSRRTYVIPEENL